MTASAPDSVSVDGARPKACPAAGAPTSVHEGLDLDTVWAVLNGVPDPEIPAVSVCDLGIVREVTADATGITVVVTPTYSACPATDVIHASIRAALLAAGARSVRVESRLVPAWTTDWIAASARERLRECGIVPPDPVAAAASRPVHLMLRRPCPRCASARTEQLSAFGSTACKALHRCLECGEPFEYFKTL